MRVRNVFLVLAIASAVVLAFIWLEVGRGLRWLDVAFAAGCGILLTPFIFAIHRRRPAGTTPSSFLTRFVAGFAVYLSACMLFLVLPSVYLSFLHRLDKGEYFHNILFSVGWSLLMGLSRAAGKGEAPSLPKPGEPGYDLKKEPWFNYEVPLSSEKPSVPVESEREY